MDATCGVRFTRYYRASPAEVWAALTDADSVARWLAPVRNLDLFPGSSIELEADSGVALGATVRVVEIERLLVIDWATPGEEPSVVRFELRPDGEGTVLALDHRLIDARVGMRAMSRWKTHLTRLDALLGEGETR